MDTSIISKLKVKLQIKDPYLGAIAYQVNYEYDETLDAKAATDGTTIYLGEGFFDPILSTEDRVGILAHECMHIGLCHSIRKKALNADQSLWNTAADYAINYVLTQANIKLPAGHLVCPRQFEGMSSEEIYKAIAPPPQHNPPMSACGNGNGNGNNSNHNNQGNSKQGNQPNNNNNSSIPPEVQKDMQNQFANDVRPASDANSKEALSNAIKARINCTGSKVYSEMSQEIERVISELVKPSLPWDKILRNYVNDKFPDDYSWKRPNRRFMEVAYLPSICDGEALKSLSVYIDVSGSVSDELLNKFLSEVKYLYESLEIDKLRIVLWSTDIDGIIEMTGSWRNPPEFPSGGGTYITPVLEDITKDKATVSVIITDGYFRMDEDTLNKIKTPLVWCIYDNNSFETPKGKVIEINA